MQTLSDLAHYYFYYYFFYFFKPNTPQRTARGHQRIFRVSCRMRYLGSTSFGDPRGLDRLDQSGIPGLDRLDRLDGSGIPEGSIDSIDRGSLKGDPLGLDRSEIPEGSIDSIDRGSPRTVEEDW